MRKPKIGDIVHYYRAPRRNEINEFRIVPAIIVELLLHPELGVKLAIFKDDGISFKDICYMPKNSKDKKDIENIKGTKMSEYKKKEPVMMKGGLEGILAGMLWHISHLLVDYEDKKHLTKELYQMIDDIRKVWDLVPESNQPIYVSIPEEELAKLDTKSVQRAEKLIYRESDSNCNQLKDTFHFEDFEIYPFDAYHRDSIRKDDLWFRRSDGEGMQLPRQVLKDALEKLFKEHM